MTVVFGFDELGRSHKMFDRGFLRRESDSGTSCCQKLMTSCNILNLRIWLVPLLSSPLVAQQYIPQVRLEASCSNSLALELFRLTLREWLHRYCVRIYRIAFRCRLRAQRQWYPEFTRARQSPTVAAKQSHQLAISTEKVLTSSTFLVTSIFQE